MAILQLFRCMLGKHHRDRKRARHDGITYHSVCTGCGTPMMRAPSGWEVAKKPAGGSQGGSV